MAAFVLVQAPQANSNTIGSASNVNALTAVQRQLSTLTNTVNTGITNLSSSNVTVAVNAAITALKTPNVQMTVFKTSSLTAQIFFTTANNFIIDVSGTPTGITDLTLDLSGIGVNIGASNVITPLMQSGFIQILWPVVSGVTHTVNLPAPFALFGGGTTIDMSTDGMILYRYVITVIDGNYTNLTKLNQGIRNVYLSSVIS